MDSAAASSGALTVLGSQIGDVPQLTSGSDWPLMARTAMTMKIASETPS